MDSPLISIENLSHINQSHNISTEFKFKPFENLINLLKILLICDFLNTIK